MPHASPAQHKMSITVRTALEDDAEALIAL